MDISCHHVVSVNIYTKVSGETRWTNMDIYDSKGNKVEVKLFADDGKPITLKLGEDE